MNDVSLKNRSALRSPSTFARLSSDPAGIASRNSFNPTLGNPTAPKSYAVGTFIEIKGVSLRRGTSCGAATGRSSSQEDLP